MSCWRGTTGRYLYGNGNLLNYAETPYLDGRGDLRQGLNTSTGHYTGQFDFSAFEEAVGGFGSPKGFYDWGRQIAVLLDSTKCMKYTL